MTVPILILSTTTAALALVFWLARPLALIAGVAAGLIAFCRLVNALYGGDRVLFARDALLTTLCAVLFWALLILIP